MTKLSSKRAKHLRSIAALLDVVFIELERCEPRSAQAKSLREKIMTEFNNLYGNVARVVGK